MPFRGALAAFVLVVFGSASFAEDALSAGSLELYPTWHAVGIEISYAGDDDADGKASFVWKRAGEMKWRNGVELTRDTARRFWWGSVFPLEPGERIEVEVAFEDPDGLKRETLAARATTRVMPAELPGGRHVHVRPDGGGSIAGATKALRAGDVLHVASGLYRESVELGASVRGRPGLPIVLVGEGPTQPVIDASVEIEKGSAWTEIGGGVFSHLFKGQGAARLLTQDGRRVYGYTSLGELQADAQKAGRAFFHDERQGRVYLRTGTDRTPVAHAYRLGQRDHAFHLKGASHVVIRNFEFRHTSREAIRISGGGDGNAIIGNTFTNCATAIGMNDIDCDETAIWDNTCVMRGQADFVWQAAMREHWSFSRDALLAWTGRGTSIVGNRIDGYHNLIALEPPPGGPREAATAGIAGNRDLDVIYNELFNASDDAIEADYGGVNMRIYGNRVRNANSGVSVAPCVRGPVYVLRNEFTFRTLMFKFGIGGGTSHGACYSDHNSGYGLTGNSSMGIYFNKDLPTTRKHFRNNVLVLPETDATLSMRPGNVLDGNCYWRPGGKTPVKFQWRGAWLHGLSAFQAASGMEKHGLIADPMLLATPGLAGYVVSDYTQSCARRAGVVLRADESDFSLRPGSPCVDRGVLIRGVNEDFAGLAPDVGAVESGKPGPRALGAPVRAEKKERGGRESAWALAARRLKEAPAPASKALLAAHEELIRSAREEAGAGRYDRAAALVEKAAAEAGGEEAQALAALAAGFRAGMEMRGWIAEGVSSGRRAVIWVDLLGTRLRGKVRAVDDDGLLVVAYGQEVPIRWGSLPPKKLLSLARKYAAPEGEDPPPERSQALARFARATGLEE